MKFVVPSVVAALLLIVAGQWVPWSALLSKVAIEDSMAPLYYQFAQDCRLDDGYGMTSGCQSGLNSVYQELGHEDAQSACSIPQFWRVSDQKIKDPNFMDLDWRTAVRDIVSDPTVCAG